MKTERKPVLRAFFWAALPEGELVPGGSILWVLLRGLTLHVALIALGLAVIGTALPPSADFPSALPVLILGSDLALAIIAWGTPFVARRLATDYEKRNSGQ